MGEFRTLVEKSVDTLLATMVSYSPLDVTGDYQYTCSVMFTQ